MMVKYIVIEEPWLSDLQKRVNEYLEQGGKLKGGVAVAETFLSTPIFCKVLLD